MLHLVTIHRRWRRCQRRVGVAMNVVLSWNEIFFPAKGKSSRRTSLHAPSISPAIFVSFRRPQMTSFWRHVSGLPTSHERYLSLSLAKCTSLSLFFFLSLSKCTSLSLVFFLSFSLFIFFFLFLSFCHIQHTVWNKTETHTWSLSPGIWKQAPFLVFHSCCFFIHNVQKETRTGEEREREREWGWGKNRKTRIGWGAFLVEISF